MKKRIYTGTKNTGAYSGGPGQSYASFRYGEKNSRPVYVPGKKQPPVFKNKDQRDHAVGIAAGLLGEWKLTPFEHEGAVRAGLRSALCLDQVAWPLADTTAAEIVQEVLDRNGRRRPTFEEGQRQYVEPRENCAWCQAELPDDLQGGGDRKRFCSEVCARSALTHWDFEARNNTDRMWRAARDSLYRSRRPAQPCVHCGRLFRSNVVSAEFCSNACRYAEGSRYRATHQCQFCGDNFDTTSQKAKYCSAPCTQAAGKLRRGYVLKLLLPHVFDHFITVPAEASRPKWLTPERFDDLVAA